MNALRVVSWNMEGRQDGWRELIGNGYDLALLQEAGPPPDDVRAHVQVDDAPWHTGGSDVAPRAWRCAVVGLSDQVQVRHVACATLDDARYEQLPVSRTGTLAAAHVRVLGSDTPLVFASMYAPFELPRVPAALDWIYADASAHRLVSDLSALVGSEHSHRMVVAADLNIAAGDDPTETNYWRARHASVFDRMRALGLPFTGPHPTRADAQRAGERREPRAVTYRTEPNEPMSATKRVDFVFASDALRNALDVRAINDVARWGRSSHCRIEIDLQLGEVG